MIAMVAIEESIATSEHKIKFLNESHLDQILCLQEIIARNLSDPKSYYVEPPQFFCKQLSIENSGIGFFQKNQLLGFNMVTFPALGEDNLGVEIGLSEEGLSQVAQIGPAAVHPDYRKRGILSQIAERHIQVIKEMGYRHIFLTVAPNNYPTIKVFLDHGFAIKQVKIKFNNLLRYILHLDIINFMNKPQYSVRIPNSDIESQKFMIKLGFYGYDVVKNDNGFDLVFGYDEIKA
jgi:ribosomal protein S18 acetylase RimI-like enzyme